jgi:hypothetical protein
LAQGKRVRKITVLGTVFTLSRYVKTIYHDFKTLIQ